MEKYSIINIKKQIAKNTQIAKYILAQFNEIFYRSCLRSFTKSVNCNIMGCYITQQQKYNRVNHDFMKNTVNTK